MVGISVVVVSYNSQKIIEPTLHSLFTQKNIDQINWEVILVNNNSTDDTVKLAQSVAELYNFKNFKVVDELQAGTAFARFKGLTEAKYEIVCFVDDDNRVEANFIAKAAALMQNTEIGILGCGGVGEFEEPPPAWFANEQDAYAIGQLFTGQNLQEVTEHGILPTAGMCLRKEIFTKLKTLNWQPQLVGRTAKSQAPGEDAELCQAARLLGYKLFYTSDLSFKHYMPKGRITWARFLEMTYGFGVTDIFLLPYQLEYSKRKQGSNFSYFLRKHWLINYLGKKITLLQLKLKATLGIISAPDFEKYKARNDGFCEIILNEKQRFKQTFDHVARLK